MRLEAFHRPKSGHNEIHEEDVTPFLLVLAVLLGFAPGMIAHGKGRNFFLWWLYGVVLGPVALVHAMILRDTRRPQFAEAPARRSPRWDSPWPLLLWATSSFAVAIITIAAYYIAVPGKYSLIAAKNKAAVSTDRGGGNDPAHAQQLSSIGPQPPAAMTAPPEPDPEVKVTIRHDDIPTADKPQTAHTLATTPEAKPEPAAAEADPAPKPAVAPQPPAPTTETLERTIATTADSVPEPKPAPPKAAPIKDVRTARAMPAPPPEADETVTKEPKSAAQPRDKASRPTPPKRHAEHKPDGFQAHTGGCQCGRRNRPYRAAGACRARIRARRRQWPCRAPDPASHPQIPGGPRPRADRGNRLCPFGRPQHRRTTGARLPAASRHHGRPIAYSCSTASRRRGKLTEE